MSKLDEFLEKLDCACTDGSCIFRPSTAKGMVTNGGCKCLRYGDKAKEAERLFRWMKQNGKWDD